MSNRSGLARCSVFVFAALAAAIPCAAQQAKWQALNAQAAQLEKQGKYPEAAQAAQEALSVAEATFGPEHPLTSAALNRLGSIDSEMGKYAEAEELIKRALAIGTKALGPDHPGVAAMENNLAAIYDGQGRYAEAETYYKLALSGNEKALGPNHPDVASDLSNLALLYTKQGRYEEAEPLYKRALVIDQKALGPANPGFATDLHNLAMLYNDQGRYGDSERLYRGALAIDEKALGPDHPAVANQLNGLAELYSDQGRYGEVEPLLKRALAIYKKSLGPDHPTVATALDNLALLYQTQGRYAEAEPLMKRALAAYEEGLGPEHPSVATNLLVLATLYNSEGQYAKAVPLLKRALAIDQKALGPNHTTVAAILNLLGAVYEAQERYQDAEPLYKASLTIVVKALGPDHIRTAAGLNNLAACYKHQGRYAEAESLYRRAIAINEMALGPDHPDLARNLINLALLYEAWGRNADAGPVFERSLEITHKRFQYGFAYMSEKDRLQFLATVQNLFPAYFSFAVAQRTSDPAIVGRVYDLLLWQKGLVGTSVAALRAQVASSGDPQTVKLLDDLTAKRNEASQIATARPPDWQARQAKVNAEANELEQQLARRVSSFGVQTTLDRARWQDVQKALRPDDAAVEFVRFQVHDGKKFTTTFSYAALVLKPQSAMPSFVLLGDAQKLESSPVVEYRASVGATRGVLLSKDQQPAGAPASAATSGAAYNAFWKPLEPALAGAKRIYVSTDGVLNQIPMGLFADPSGQLLLEKYDLRPVNSTKDLLRPARAAGSKSAVLLGNPEFAMSEQEQRIAVEKLKAGASSQAGPVVTSAGPGTRSIGAAGSRLPPLPSTLIEVDLVEKRLKEAGWQVTSYTGEMALEEAVVSQRSPRLLHIATHGFFLADPESAPKNSAVADQPAAISDPMLRSGLFFAGADRAQMGAPPASGLDDGVLTACQAAQLELQGTELVVLSACETGLGAQKNGEGVFGLRRGLQEAGAEAVLMSMWSVPDRETQELMALFYQKWLGGLDKHEALRQAQIKEREIVRQRYGKDLPFYWGAFVLVGR